jgi:hypothetical protein
MKKSYLSRFIDEDLLKWSRSNNRKPLLLRGVRQVGKTTAIRKLAQHFKSYIEVNFEEHQEVHQFFKGNLSPDEIVENLSIYFNTPVIDSKTLIFFDEIQACVPALSSLRFFYEKRSGLHVVAAGSLLEFALQSIPSFGVGRIRSMFMYPLSFDEFLLALGEKQLIESKRSGSSANPLNDAIHQKLIRYLKKFLILGGMPEVVMNYINGESIVECQQILNDLMLTYLDDFAKYKERASATLISEVFTSVVQQVGNKFVYSRSSSQASHYQIKEALSLLIKAGLVVTVTHSSANGIPLGAQVKPSFRKMLIIDSGLAYRMSGLNINEIIISDSVEFVNKGIAAELFVGLELLKAQSPYERTDLYYWQREALNSNAEVDYLLQKGESIVPIEVKSGTKGSMQSLYLFLKEKNIKKGVRVSLENFSEYQNIIVIPMYGVGDFVRKLGIY